MLCHPITTITTCQVFDCKVIHFVWNNQIISKEMYEIARFCLLFNTYGSNVIIILTLTTIRMSFHKYIKNIKINKYIWIINQIWNNILIFTPGLNHRLKKYYSIIKNRKKNEKKVFYRGYTSHVRHNAYNIVCRFVLVVQQVGILE